MERHGRLMRTMTGWKCSGCDFETQVQQEAVAKVVHQSFSPRCLAGSPLDETQQVVSGTGSLAGPGHLESDDVIATSPIRYGHHEPNSLMRPYGTQYSLGASSEADLWPARRLSNDLVATDALQGRASAISQHPYSFPQPPGRSKDEGLVGFNPWRQLGSDDVVYQRDLPEEKERSQATDQQPISSRIEKAIRSIKQFQCVVCREQWRSTATTLCRHFVCCSPCFQQTSENCVVCRGEVKKPFPVKFQSAKLLDGLDIPFLLKATIEEDKLQALLGMGFPESTIMRANHLIQIQSISQAQPDITSVLDFMLSNPNPVPSMEEMEFLLNDPNVDETVKSRLCDYLEAICKCAICRRNFPNICLLPCRHLALCRPCLHSQPVPEICPDCEMPIKNQLAVYMA